MNKREAKKLTGEIRSKANDLTDLVIRAYDEEAWITLGYNSFEQYAEAEFTQGYIRLIPDERAEVVEALADRQMSRRGIGKALGVSKDTVSNDLRKRRQVSNNSTPGKDAVVIGIDGKHYPAQQKPKPEPVIDPEARPYPLPTGYCDGRYEGFTTAFKDMNAEFKGMTTNPTHEQLAKLERWLNRALQTVNKLQEVIRNDAATA